MSPTLSRGGALAILGLALAVLLLAARPAGAIEVQRVVSAGGIEAWLVEDHSLPILSLELSFGGAGSASEPKEKGGLARMTASLLDEGAGDIDSDGFHARLEDLVSSVHFSADIDRMSGELSTITANRDAAFELLRLAMTQPRFDPEPVERIRADLVADLAQRAENPNAIASRTWWREAFGEHPYARPPGGTAASLAALTIADLKGFAATRLARDRLKIGVAGDITAGDLATLLDRTFAALPATASRPEEAPAQVGDAGALLLVRKSIPQSVATFGAPGLKRDDPDWYAALIDNYILGGGGFASRLVNEVRVKRGLAYGVGTSLVPLVDGGAILGNVATQNGRIAQSIEIIREEWRRFGEEGPTAAELESAKTYLTGAFPLQFDQTPRIAAILVQLQEDGLGIDYLDHRNGLILAVTLDEARRVARRLFDPARMSFVVVGSPTNLTPTREVETGG